MLLSESISLFLEYQERRKGRTAATITTYRSLLGLFYRFIGECEISALSVRKIDEYADNLADLKPRSVKNRLCVVRSLVAWLYAKGLTDMRPQAIDLPVFEDTEANFLDYDEQRDLIAATQNNRERAIILLLLRSGLRISELCDLRRDDIFERSVVVRNGKGSKARVTFIDLETERVLCDYWRERPSQYAVCDRVGGDLSRQFAHRVIVTVARRAGLKKSVTPHTLRHTFATNMLRAGARVEDAQKMLGHANIRTTMIYLHFTDDYLHSRYDEFIGKEYRRK